MPEVPDRALIHVTRAPAMGERSKGALSVRTDKIAALRRASATQLIRIRMPACLPRPRYARATVALRVEAA